MTEAEVLDKMRETLNTRGWCREHYQDSAGRVCLAGALYLVVNGFANACGAGDGFALCVRIRGVFTECLQERDGISFGIENYNDNSHTTLDDILSLIDCAKTKVAP